jgi:hypothetical protein
MKSYDELKAEMETIQQQMVEAKSIIVTPSAQLPSVRFEPPGWLTMSLPFRISL